MQDDFRNPLADAPAAAVFFGLCLCLSLSDMARAQAAFVPSWLIIGIVLLSIAALLLFGVRSVNPSYLPYFLFLLIFLSLASWNLLARTDAACDVPTLAEGRGTVTLLRSWGQRRVALVRGGEGLVLLFIAAEGEVHEGSLVSYSGTGTAFNNAADFNEERYWRGKGVRYAVECDNILHLKESRSFATWRRQLSQRIEERLPPRTAGYLLASWVGVRDQELETLHRNVGTSHLLAVSGFHVGVVAALLRLCLRPLRRRSLFIGPVVWCYTALTGAGSGAVRAALMIQINLLGRVVGRPSSSFNSAAAAGVLMLIKNPWVFWDVSWRLSMLAIISLTALASLTMGDLSKALLSSPFAWLATSLEVTRVFGHAPLAGIIANYAALPVFALLLPFASLLSLPALCNLPGGERAAALMEFLFSLWEKLSGDLRSLCPWSAGPSLPLTVAAAVALILVTARAQGFSRIRSVLLLALLPAPILLFLIK